MSTARARQLAGNEDRARKASLLDMIAKRRQQGAAGGILGLEDSSDDEHASQQQPPARPQRATLLADLEDSDSGEEENRTSNSSSGHSDRGSGAAAAKPLGRLVKRADMERQPQHHPRASGGSSSVDDLTAGLGGLSINRSAGAPAVPGRLPAVHASRRPPAPPAAADSDSEGGEGDEGQCLTLGERGQFKLSAALSQKLYPHQVDGVKWLWGLHQTGTGGILADDMGLGKTMQCSAFLTGLLQCKLIRRAMVIAPKTLLAHWVKELGVCGVGRLTNEYFGTENERARCLDRVFHHRGVLLTTYGMVLHNSEALATFEEHDADEGPLWDVMILDEGHKIKNPRMQLRKRLDEIPVATRIIISGTPIQNNLMEMHTLFDFACPELLDDARTFKDNYEKRISIGNDKHATQGERERGAVAAAKLRQTIAPYFLRREKKDVFSTNDSTDGGGSGGSSTAAGGASTTASGASKPQSMGRKNDFIVWLRLKPMQRKVYEAFLNSDAVKAVFNQTNSALAAITVLKKICDHPALLSKRAESGIVSGANRARRLQLGGAESSGESDIEEASSGEEEEYYSDEGEGGYEGGGRQLAERKRKSKKRADTLQADLGGGEGADGEGGWWDWAKEGASDQLLHEVHTTGFEASCKTVFVMALLHNLVSEGHRTLIFSQSRVMLNILEAAIKAEGWHFCRIDGSVTSAQEREKRVKQFQGSSDIPIFLLTSQVGGLGLTLTAADRVIIVDPAWNPSTDNQAVDRAYRIGQSRDVVVYRLISCGTVEEKIYRKQVYKGGLSRTGTEDGEQFRYFSQQELRDLFRLDPEEAVRSATQRALHDMHAAQRRATPALSAHLSFLEQLEGFAGVSDHDLLYSKKVAEGSGDVPFGSQPPEAAPGQQRQPARVPTSGIKKAAAQEWSGASDISDMFSRALSLGGSSSGSAGAAAVAVAPGRGTAPPTFSMPATSQQLGRPGKSSQQLLVQDLEAKLRRQQALLGSSAMLSTLPDGGARIRATAEELQRQLDRERAKLQLSGLGGSSDSGGDSSTGVGSGTSSGVDSGMGGSVAGAGMAAGAGGSGSAAAGSGGAAGVAPRTASGAAGGWGTRPAAAVGAPTAARVPEPKPAAGSAAPPPPPVQEHSSVMPAGVAGTSSASVPVPPVSPLRRAWDSVRGMASSMLGASGKTTEAQPAAQQAAVAGGSSAAPSRAQQARQKVEVVDLSLDDDEDQPSLAEGAAQQQGPGAATLRSTQALASEQGGAVAAAAREGPGAQDSGTASDAAAASELEAQRGVCKQLKRRLVKYATQLQAEQEASQLADGGEKLRRKVERLQAEYTEAKRKYRLLEAAALSLP